MTKWTSEELTKIGTAEELRIASLRRDGTLRNPVTIWVVRLGDDLYVRSANGRTRVCPAVMSTVPCACPTPGRCEDHV